MEKSTNIIVDTENAAFISALIESRLNELGDRRDENYETELFAILSMADYALKNLSSRNDQESVDRIFDTLKKFGYEPQYGVSGAPSFRLEDIVLSPKGDLCANISSEPDSFAIHIIANRAMRTLFMISGRKDEELIEVSFSPDSKYISVVTRNLVTFWSIPEIRICNHLELTEDIYTDCCWSNDSGKFSIGCRNHIYVVDMNDKSIIELPEDEYGPDLICLNDDGSSLLSLNPLTMQLYRNQTPKNYVSPLEPEYGPCSRIIYRNGMFYAICLYGALPISGDAVPQKFLRFESNVFGCDYDELINEISEKPKRIEVSVNSNHCLIHIPDKSIHNSIRIDSDLKISLEHEETDTDIDAQQSVKLPLFTVNDGTYSGKVCIKPDCLLGYEYTKPESGFPKIVISRMKFKDADETRKIQYLSETAKILFKNEKFSEYGPFIYDNLERDLKESYNLPENYLSCQYYIHEYIPFDIPYLDKLSLLYDLKDNPYVRWKRTNYDDLTVNSTIVPDGLDNIVVIDNEGEIYPFKFFRDVAILVTENIIAAVDQKSISAYNPEVNDFIEIVKQDEMEDLHIRSPHNIRQIFFNSKEVLINCIDAREKTSNLRIDGKWKHFEYNAHKTAILFADQLMLVDSNGFDVLNKNSLEIMHSDEFMNKDLWSVSGVSSDGTLNLICIRNFANKDYQSADILFGRMRSPEFSLEVFGNSMMRNYPRPVSSPLELRGLDVTYISSEEGNPSNKLNYAKISKSDLTVKRVLKPNVSRLDTDIVPIDDKHYLVSSKTSMWSDYSTKHPLKLMTIAFGRMKRYNENQTEGQLSADNCIPGKDCTSCLIHSDSYLVSECKDFPDYVIKSWDVFTGRRYDGPEGHLRGRIIDHDDETVTVGIFDEDSYGCVSATVFDNHLVKKYDVSLDVKISRLLRYDSLWRVDPEIKGKSVIVPYKNIYKEKIIWENVPILTPMGKAELVDCHNPSWIHISVRDQEKNHIFKQRFSFEILYAGRLSNRMEKDLTFDLPSLEEPEDQIEDIIKNKIRIYLMENEYMIFQTQKCYSDEVVAIPPSEITSINSGKNWNYIDYFWSGNGRNCEPIAIQGDTFNYITHDELGTLHKDSTGIVRRIMETNLYTEQASPLYLDENISLIRTDDGIIVNCDEGSFKFSDEKIRSVSLTSAKSPRYHFAAYDDEHILVSNITIDIESGTMTPDQEKISIIESTDLNRCKLLKCNGIYVVKR